MGILSSLIPTRFSGPLIGGLLAIGVIGYQKVQAIRLESTIADLKKVEAEAQLCGYQKKQLADKISNQNKEISALQLKAKTEADEAARRATITLRRKWSPPANHGAEEMESWLDSYR